VGHGWLSGYLPETEGGGSVVGCQTPEQSGEVGPFAARRVRHPSGRDL